VALVVRPRDLQVGREPQGLGQARRATAPDIGSADHEDGGDRIGQALGALGHRSDFDLCELLEAQLGEAAILRRLCIRLAAAPKTKRVSPCRLTRSNFGGADGARTRDPRRDRPGNEVSIHAGLRAISVPKFALSYALFPGGTAIKFQQTGHRSEPQDVSRSLAPTGPLVRPPRHVANDSAEDATVQGPLTGHLGPQCAAAQKAAIDRVKVGRLHPHR
jgi:hypothetical protein